MSRFRPGGLLAVSLLALTLTLFTHATNAGPPWNIVLIYTDDQRWDSLCWETIGLPEICSQPRSAHPMPTIENVMNNKSVVFSNAFVSNPICCPARASVLAGGYYAHSTTVLNNNTPNGSYRRFIDQASMAVQLQEHGYKTALIGKYLNGYGDAQSVDPLTGTAYIPPGWSSFEAHWASNSNWTTFKRAWGSSTPEAPGIGQSAQVTNSYLTDYQAQKAIEFLDATCGYQSCSAPFFLMLTPIAPHRPAAPAARHQNLFTDYTYRERGWAEQPDGDLGDKPAYVGVQAARWEIPEEDAFHRNQLRSLRAVDDAFKAIVDNLQQKKLFNKTVFIFASDNGVMWGEHMLTEKGKPYEESIRVPLWVRLPGAVGASRTETRLVDVNRDVPATILGLAGLASSQTEGSDLQPLIRDPGAPWREELLFEFWNYDTRPGFPPNWVAIRDDSYKYVAYTSGEVELYDLSIDPYELQSRHLDPDYTGVLSQLQARLDALPRGVAIRTDNFPDPGNWQLPTAYRNQVYYFQLMAWGGSGNYSWSIYHNDDSCQADLPPGLVLTADGLLTGVPTTNGAWAPCFQVQDDSNSPQPGNDRPQSHILPFRIPVINGNQALLVLPDAHVGELYNYKLPEVIAAGRVTWQLFEDDSTCHQGLPTGLTLLGSGEISGTLHQPGAYTICVVPRMISPLEQDGLDSEPSGSVMVLDLRAWPLLPDWSDDRN